MDQKSLAVICKRLGMSKYAASVYEIVRTKGPVSATHIVSLIGENHRPAVYKAIDELYGYKIILKTPKGKRFLFTAAHPKRITELFKDTSVETEKIIGHISPEESSLTQNMKTYHGPIGIRDIFDDCVTHSKKGETFYRYTSELNLDIVNTYLSPDYRKKRDVKKLERMVISNPISQKQKRPRLERFIKYIPQEKDLFDQNIIQLVYGSRIAIIDLNIEEGVVIEHAALAEFQKTIFRQLYRRL